VGKIMMGFIKQNRWTLLSIFIIVPIGFYSKFYDGFGRAWVNDSLGGALYEIFWCLVFFLFFSNTAPWKIAVLVFAVTSLLEFLQLCHPPLLELIRRNFIGRTFIGTSFIWSDFIYYFFGCLIGWMWLKILPTRRINK
jgi:hypothetical protein